MLFSPRNPYKMHLLNIPRHIFREYDIRGVIGSDLSEDFAFLLGKAYAQVVPVGSGAPIAVGFDCRPTSKLYAQALIRGLLEHGRDVVEIGMVPTPALYWTIFHSNLAGGIQVTGSHNPADNNGFKMCVGKDPMSPEMIQSLIPLCEEALANGSHTGTREGTVTYFDALTPYISEIVEGSQPRMGKKKLTVVVDAGNGVAGLLGVPVLKELGVHVVPMFCEPDGLFPNHHPDPTLPENVKTLATAILSHGADCGIGWDGD